MKKEKGMKTKTKTKTTKKNYTWFPPRWTGSEMGKDPRRPSMSDMEKMPAPKTTKKVVPTVLITVGGDNGDGIVDLVKKPKGVRVIIKDYDNACENGGKPQVREWEP